MFRRITPALARVGVTGHALTRGQSFNNAMLINFAVAPRGQGSLLLLRLPLLRKGSPSQERRRALGELSRRGSLYYWASSARCARCNLCWARRRGITLYGRRRLRIRRSCCQQCGTGNETEEFCHFMFPSHQHQRHAVEKVAIIPTHPGPRQISPGFLFCALVDRAFVVTASRGFVPPILE